MTEPDLPEPPPPGQPGVNRYGRTGALTEALQKRIVQVVSAGNYLKVAAQYCGIGESTLRLWLTKGRKAVTAREAHPPDRAYCPSCDADRTDDVDAEEQANYRELTRWEEAMRVWRERDDPLGDPSSAPTRSHAVMDSCPSCGTSDRPRPWEQPEEDLRYVAFLEAVTQAETRAEVAAVTHWRAAFANDWRAARDYLVRSKPDRWAATTRVQISQEEADRRIDSAVEQVLLAAGVDVDSLPEEDPISGELGGLFDGGSLDLDLDDDDLG